MTSLSVVERDGILVVDSRLIAEDLGVKHSDWFQNIVLTYQTEIEQEFGILRFENGKIPEAARRGRPERFAWLTEDQSTVLMTYSKNTDRVRECKRNLVKAFSKAKNLIQEQGDRIKELQLQLELAKTQERLTENQQRLLATVHLLETVAPGLAPLALGKSDAVVTRVEYVDRVITDKGTFEGIGIGYLQQRFGFKNTKQTWSWLESIGYGKFSGKWDLQLSAVEQHKLSVEVFEELVQKFASKEGDRQLLIGE